jgi:hypothetical protein
MLCFSATAKSTASAQYKPDSNSSPLRLATPLISALSLLLIVRIPFSELIVLPPRQAGTKKTLEEIYYNLGILQLKVAERLFLEIILPHCGIFFLTSISYWC